MRLPPKDEKLLLVAGTIAEQCATQLMAQGADVEELWLILAVAARVSERAVIEADRKGNDLHSYAAAKSRLEYLLQATDEGFDNVETDLARREGAPDPIRS